MNGLLNFFGIVCLDGRCARIYVERMQDWLKDSPKARTKTSPARLTDVDLIQSGRQMSET